MNRQEFLDALAAQLASLPDAERERSLAFYMEMIDDRMESGATEEEAVASLGSVNEIAGEILQNTPTPHGKQKLRGWKLALLILGAPIWLPLLAATVVVALSLVIVLWSLIAALWAMAAGITLSAPMALLSGGIALLHWNLLRSAVCTAMACATAGLAILLVLAALRATRGASRFTRTCWKKVRGAR